MRRKEKGERKEKKNLVPGLGDVIIVVIVIVSPLPT